MADEQTLRCLREDIAKANAQLRIARAALARDDSGSRNPRRLITVYDQREKLLAELAELTAQQQPKEQP